MVAGGKGTRKSNKGTGCVNNREKNDYGQHERKATEARDRKEGEYVLKRFRKTVDDKETLGNLWLWMKAL